MFINISNFKFTNNDHFLFHECLFWRCYIHNRLLCMYILHVNPNNSFILYVKIIKEHPLLGRMAINNINFFLDSKERYILNVRHSHNTYLSLASTYGIPVALFFFAPYLMVWLIFRNYPGLSVDIKNMIFMFFLGPRGENTYKSKWFSLCWWNFGNLGGRGGHHPGSPKIIRIMIYSHMLL